MKTYLYLSLLPEALVASMLPPKEFGTYLAIGSKRRSRGQAMFFEVSGLRSSDYFPLEELPRRCVPHENGEPKHSVYLSVYRVLEHIPLDVVESLFLVTRDGRVLEIARTSQVPDSPQPYHLYQEIAPVHPRIVSSLDPADFGRYITAEAEFVRVPKICFVDLRLGELAENPAEGSVRNLPYGAVEHLRDCLMQLRNNPDKRTKVVDRTQPQGFPFRSVESGVYLVEGSRIAFYPFPGERELQTTYFEWWRSASIMGDSSAL